MRGTKREHFAWLLDQVCPRTLKSRDGPRFGYATGGVPCHKIGVRPSLSKYPAKFSNVFPSNWLCVRTRLSTEGAWRLAHGLQVRRGGPFLCPPVPRRVRSSDQGSEPLLGQAGPKWVHNPIVRSLLADGRTQEGSAPTQLHEPCPSDGILGIVSSQPRTLGVSLHKVQSKFRISNMVRFSLNFDRLGLRPDAEENPTLRPQE